MRSRYAFPFVLLLLAAFLATACRPAVQAEPTALPTLAPPAPRGGMTQIRGSFQASTDFVIGVYMVEHAVALVDLHGFIVRDREWEIPVESQVLGYVDVDVENLSGTYDLNLPLRPEGTLNDVDHDDEADVGVQVFAVAYWPNLSGGPFAVGDDRSFGWPTYLASIRTDPENADEVIGGNLIVWAPDDEQEFPTGFGEDGLLFTEDDPMGPIPAGYSVVDLDQEPFVISQEESPQIPLYEPEDVHPKDFSSLSYMQAFEKMFEIVRREYAFNGFEGKEPDWDAPHERLYPMVEQAEEDGDAQAFYAALREFTLAFRDGHVSLRGGVANQAFTAQTEGGYGFAIRELDNGRVLVTHVVSGGPAEAAGIQVGDEIVAFNGQAIAEAIGQVVPFAAPLSTDFALRYQQARYLLRAPVGTEARITFINHEGLEQTVVLQAIAERESFNLTSIYAGHDPNALPVEFRFLDAGVGYIRVNSNYDDLNLILRLFERALKTFQENEVTALVVDLRQNAGGNPLGLAGFLYDEEIPLGQLEYYSERTGKFEPEGPPDKVLPNQNQYRFDRIALLVGQACASACEIEAYAFSQVPGVVVVGETPTAGAEAEVARGQFLLPEGLSLQVPTGRLVLPDGRLFLEGSGVAPDVRVPVTEETVLSSEDEVLKAALEIVSRPLGAGIVPAGPPKLADPLDAEAALRRGTPALEDRARESYPPEELSQAGRTYTYTVPLSESETLIWMNGWCATSADLLTDNLQAMTFTFSLDGAEVPLEDLATLDTEPPVTAQYCRLYYTALSDWPAGEHHLRVEVTFARAVNDGLREYEAGKHIYEYVVYVRP